MYAYVNRFEIDRLINKYYKYINYMTNVHIYCIIHLYLYVYVYIYMYTHTCTYCNYKCTYMICQDMFDVCRYVSRYVCICARMHCILDEYSATNPTYAPFFSAVPWKFMDEKQLLEGQNISLLME